MSTAVGCPKQPTMLGYLPISNIATKMAVCCQGPINFIGPKKVHAVYVLHHLSHEVSAILYEFHGICYTIHSCKEIKD